MQTIHLNPDQLPVTLRGGYKGKRIAAQVTESVFVPATAGLWEGGTRNVYRAVRLADGVEMSLSDGNAAWSGNQKDSKYTLPAGIVVVREIQGSYSDLTIYVRPEDIAPLLPTPVSDIPHYGKLVLQATRNLKSSYGGKDRYEMMRDEYRYGGLGVTMAGEPFPTRAQWDEAKQALIGMGLLNKAGAITVAGRNAIAIANT